MAKQAVPQFLTTAQTFSRDIQVMHEGGIDYMDAIITWCEQNSMEVEAAAALIKKDSVLKAKMEAEAIRKNMLKIKKGVELPI